MTRARVLDFGMGNLRSVARALERAGAQVEVGAEVDPRADLLVVPGQGSFGACVANLGERLASVGAWIESGRPYLGLCLGLQILLQESDEDPDARGLGVLAGRVRRLPDTVKVPHIGWNEVRVRNGHDALAAVAPGTRFYFVHSYVAAPDDDAAVAATAEHGVEFAAAVSHGPVFATQFHPEKSGDAGQAVLRAYLGSL